jgi:hypothetical protein
MPSFPRLCDLIFEQTCLILPGSGPSQPDEEGENDLPVDVLKTEYTRYGKSGKFFTGWADISLIRISSFYPFTLNPVIAIFNFDILKPGTQKPFLDGLQILGIVIDRR